MHERLNVHEWTILLEKTFMLKDIFTRGITFARWDTFVRRFKLLEVSFFARELKNNYEREKNEKKKITD